MPNPLHAFARPTLLAAGLAALLAAAAPDVGAQRRAHTPACTDFYSVTNQAWLEANAAAARPVSALGELKALAERQQLELLEAAMNSPQNNVQQLLGDFWASGLDEAAVEADGAQPIVPLLSRIDAIRRARDIPPAIAALHQVGIPVLFDFTADVDLEQLSRHIGYFTQGGLGLPDPAFYTRTDADTQALMERYREYVGNILTLTGTPPASLEQDVATVLDVETRIASQWRALSLMRDPRSNYAPIPVAQLGSYKRLRLDQFLKAMEADGDTVSMANPELFTVLDGLVSELKPAQWKAYLRFHVGNAMAPYLSDTFRQAAFDFHGRVLRGETEPAPRQTQLLAAINRAAGPMLAREYVARYLPATTRSRAQSIAEQVRDALHDAATRAPWLGEPARAEALAKIDALRIEVGAPADDLDFSVQPMGRGSFGSNMLIASAWHHREEMRRIGRTNADRRWEVLPQQPALAYDLAQNRLMVSAAVLQPPVLDMSRDGAAHYGSFGALVGHELGRAIDIQGRHVDASGQVREWWTAGEEAAWDDRANRLAAQYGGYAYPGAPEIHVNGSLTRNENAADLAGLELSWQALQTATPELPRESAQHFFTAWAELWREQMPAAGAAQHAASSVHVPGQWRANGPLANLAAFSEAFQCKAGAPMLRPAEQQVSIWAAGTASE